jgi:hypothetical protein
MTCPQDGDTIETTIYVTPQAENATPREPSTEVRIVTEVEAVPSCNLSTANVLVPGNGLFMDDATLKVEAALLDIDGIPITSSLPAAVVTFNAATSSTDQTLLMTRQSLGSNVLDADIPPELRSKDGVYTVKVVLKNGWLGANANAAVQQADCVLLDQVLHVKPRVHDEGFNTGYIILGCAIGASILIVLLVLVVRKYRDRFEHVLQAVIVEVFKLTFAWAFEGGDVATDGINFYRTVVSSEIKVGYVLPTRYKIAYIFIMCTTSAAAALSAVYRTKVTLDLFRQIRQQQSEATNSETGKSSDTEAMNALKSKQKILSQKRWEVEKTKRDILGIGLHALTAMCEGMTAAKMDCFALCDFLVQAATRYLSWAPHQLLTSAW